MSQVGVFLGGEGRNELGSWSGHPPYQDSSFPGVIETLLRRVQDEGWQVVGAAKWIDIRKLRATGPTPNEERNVLGLVLEAKRAGSRVLAFVRDADDDRQRPKTIDDAIVKSKEAYPEIEVIGGTAIPVLEAWILALLGEHHTESLGKAAAQTKLTKKGIEDKDTKAMVEAITDSNIRNLPADANSLNRWLRTAEDVLHPLVREGVQVDAGKPV